MCVFYVLGGPQAPEAIIIYNHRGLGGKVCIFYVLGSPQAPEATIILGISEARCAFLTCLEALRRQKPP